MQQEELPPHPLGIYEVATKETADAVAYAFLKETGDPTQYPFKFQPLEKDEVRIQITYTGLCQSDLMTVRQKWGPCPLPGCPGHEVVGYVSKAGSECQRLKVGDRVGCNPQRDYCGKCYHCNKGDNQLCGNREFLYNPFFGGYSTHIQLKEKAVFKLPAGFREDVGSPLLCAGVTVYAPIKRWLKRNGTCAVIGIGGLGHLAVQYAAKLGMTVTAFSSTPDKKDFVNSLGATHVTSSIDLASLKEHEGKFDLVLNTLHVTEHNTLIAYQRLTKLRGSYVQLGLPDAGDNMPLDQAYIVLNQIRICGSLIGSFQETQEMLEFSSQHNVYPLVETYKFEDFPKAVHQLEFGRPRFRCVVSVLEWAKANGFEK